MLHSPENGPDPLQVKIVGDVSVDADVQDSMYLTVVAAAVSAFLAQEASESMQLGHSVRSRLWLDWRRSALWPAGTIGWEHAEHPW